MVSLTRVESNGMFVEMTHMSYSLEGPFHCHCCLAEYWSKKLGKNHLRAYQASRRGGVVTMDLREERVILTGQAVVMSQGHLLLEPS